MRNRVLEAAAPVAFVVMWSSAFIAGIIGVGAAPPMLVLFARFALAGLALTLYAVAVRAKWPRGRELFHVVVAGLLMQMVQFGAFYTAMSDHVSAAVISLVQGLNPVVIALFAGTVLGETVTPRQWAGFGIGGVGVGLAVVDQSHFSATGLVLCVVGLLGLSLGTVYQKRLVPDVDSRTNTAVHVLASAPVAGLFALAQGDNHITDPLRFTGSLIWMVLINAVACFLLLNAMLRRWDATRVGRLFFATPAVTAVMAWLLIAQPLRPLTIAGLGVGVLGMVLAARGGATAAARRSGRDGEPAATAMAHPVPR
ncbi:EamA-like transporter protein [Nocardia nova SH22a]|uniref:EamA-like transporter protein n=1 Tax=Nocardia nova SH22a TaxID=1415166 RepID=W5TSU6_9NOCA|nr:DMT family transporter [Nocardia nova]AHH22279.1 EamA-like transporter protein [Nocardia nova SH22a]